MCVSIIQFKSESSGIEMIYDSVPLSPNQNWYNYRPLVNHVYCVTITCLTEGKTTEEKSTGGRLLVVLINFVCLSVTVKMIYITESCLLNHSNDHIRGPHISAKLHTKVFNQSNNEQSETDHRGVGSGMNQLFAHVPLSFSEYFYLYISISVCQLC